MDVFSNMTLWGRIALILEILVCLLIFFMALILALRWAFAGKKVKLGLGQLASIDVDKGGQPLSGISADTVIEIVSRSVDMASKVTHIKTKQILSDQMYGLEDKIVLIQDVLLAPFRAKLFLALEAKAGPGAAPTVTSNQEYGFYVSLVALLMEDLKRNCRGTFIRNNFHRFNEREFETYVSDKAESLWIKAVNFLRDMYPSDKMTLTFEAVEKSVLSEAETDFKDEIVVVFKKAVHIYNERHAEIAEMERALREHLKGYGVNMEKARDHRVEELANDDRR